MPSLKGLVNWVMRGIGANNGDSRLAAHELRIRSARARAKAIAHSPLPAREKFEAIYRERIWANAAPTLIPSPSSSGHGSTEESTRTLRVALSEFIEQQQISSMFDAPCGDYHWMRLMRFPDGFRYIGGDIVETVVIALNAADASPNIKFIQFDLTRDVFPSVQAWLCKDCLQHLSYDDIRKVLSNFIKSDVEWALISNHVDVIANRDIATGDFRHLDLTKSPFNLPPPRHILKDSPSDNEPRSVFAWRRQDLQACLRDS